MKLPEDTIIAADKITHYLLQWQPENDKSQFLAQAGYTTAHANKLADDIRNQLLPLECDFVENTEYGNKYRIGGLLIGPNGVALRVVTIWIKESETGRTKFVTLFPAKER